MSDAAAIDRDKVLNDRLSLALADINALWEECNKCVGVPAGADQEDAMRYLETSIANGRSFAKRIQQYKS